MSTTTAEKKIAELEPIVAALLVARNALKGISGVDIPRNKITDTLGLYSSELSAWKSILKCQQNKEPK